MKRKELTISLLSLVALGAMAYDIVWFGTVSGEKMGIKPELVKSVGYDVAGNVEVCLTDEGTKTIDPTQLGDITFGDSEGMVNVAFSDGSAIVENPFAFGEGATVAIDGAKVVITCSGEEVSEIHVTGSSENAQLKVYADSPLKIVLDDVSISNNNGSAVNLQTQSPVELILNGNSVLADSKKYTTTEGEDEKGTLFCTSALTITGEGTLTVSAKKKHAIASNENVTVAGGEITVTEASSDGIHSCGFTMNDGTYKVLSAGGDGIDADTGDILIEGGRIDLNVATDDTKGMKADGNITITGGEISINVNSLQSKGIKTKADMLISGGSITAETSGDAVVVDGDPSYCTVVKVDGNLEISGGSFTAVTTGKGGKGISVDGNTLITNGDFDINCSGAGVVYQDANGNNDTYSSTCITVDGDLTIVGGTFNLQNSGSAGKCIKCDGKLAIGNEEDGPEIVAKTSGAKIREDGTGAAYGPGGGWGPGGGGWDDKADYSNPKVIKAQGDLTVYNGNLQLTSTSDGGEGLESKTVLTILGGNVDISTVDDCINAANHIEIGGGVVHCKTSSNDAIDSNGTLTISGGVVIAIGARSPECGFDCDNNRFAVTGGIVFGMGGSQSTPTSSACTQKVLVYNASIAQNALLTIIDPDGNQVLSFLNPVNLGAAKMIISSPGITSGTYKIYTGGSLAGGDEYYELTTGATYTPGAQATTFTPTSMVTTVGSSSGRP